MAFTRRRYSDYYGYFSDRYSWICFSIRLGLVGISDRIAIATLFTRTIMTRFKNTLLFKKKLSLKRPQLYMLMAVLVALILVTGCVVNLGNNGVRGSGNVKTESRSVTGFSSIAFNSEGKVTVQQTGKESLTISAEENLLPLLETRVTDHTLSIGTINNTDINPTKPIEFVMEVKSLEGFKMTGVGSIEARGIQGKHLTIALTGVGEMTIEGNADSLDLRLEGVGSYQGAAFKTKQATVHSEGVGSAVVNASEQLDVLVSGVGGVEYVGSPKVQKSGKGLGHVKQR